MKKTKIDWCDCTVNPVVGCPNGCDYCYARKINDRFHFVKDWNKPQFFPERLKEFQSRSLESVFIDSMSDVGTWKDEWLYDTFTAMATNPQHWYLLLTKTDTNVLTKKMVDFMKISNMALPAFLGKSLTTQSQIDMYMKNKEITDFLSIEPILERLDLSQAIVTTRTVIIGAETGIRKGKVVPEKEWIDDIVKEADNYNIYVFMKESLRSIMGDDFRQDALPWDWRKDK